MFLVKFMQYRLKKKSIKLEKLCYCYICVYVFIYFMDCVAKTFSGIYDSFIEKYSVLEFKNKQPTQFLQIPFSYFDFFKNVFNDSNKVGNGSTTKLTFFGGGGGGGNSTCIALINLLVN